MTHVIYQPCSASHLAEPVDGFHRRLVPRGSPSGDDVLRDAFDVVVFGESSRRTGRWQLEAASTRGDLKPQCAHEAASTRGDGHGLVSRWKRDLRLPFNLLVGVCRTQAKLRRFVMQNLISSRQPMHQGNPEPYRRIAVMITVPMGSLLASSTVAFMPFAVTILMTVGNSFASSWTSSASC